MIKKTTRNSGFSKFLFCFSAGAALFTGCRKDAADLSITKKPADSTVTVTSPKPGPSGGTPLAYMFGVDTYAWDYFASNPGTIDATKFGLIKSFNQVRHYLDWGSLEPYQGSYSFNPVVSGSWNLDAIYDACKSNNITALVDIKTCPNWLVSTFPSGLQDSENVPAPYGSDLSKPASYTLQAKVAFQFAARYGSNAKVDKSLLSVYTTPRWSGDIVNTVKVALGTVKYIECDNERDKWWKGPATKQTAAQYAANMSAFYDGDMGKLGKGVGVKNADPNMIVVMGGLAGANSQWVSDMIAWCKQNRGYKADGSVNLCFDVINYHYYNNAGGNVGAAPELSAAASSADKMLAVAKTVKDQPEVWITESGYDVNGSSPQRAPAIGSKSQELVQADWILRTSLLYIKHGIKRLFFYQLYDAAPGNSTQYATSGLAEGTTRRPSANYIAQTQNLMGNYTYVKTLSTSPMVDQYTNGTKTMWVLFMPTAKGATSTYSLDVGKSSATLYQLDPNSTKIASSVKTASANKLSVAVSETPVFVSN